MKRTVDNLLDQSRDLWSISPEATVFEALEALASHEIGAIVVVEDGALIGIVSERDYARKVILKDKSSKQTKVSEIMTREVITVAPGDRVESCMELMQRHHIRHLAVVESGVIIGMLSLRDLLTEVMVEQAAIIDQMEHYIRGDQ